MSTLSVENVSVQFGDFYAIRDVSIDVNQGEFVTLLGPSGCGKTTLLKTVSGFHTPDTGTIRIDGVDVTGTPPERRSTTMCFQSYALFPHLNVSENIVFGLRQQRVDASTRNEILNRVVRQVDLGTQLQKTPNQLSGGQQQRVALARALAMRSGIILFDEPLSNLDAILREQVRFEILELQKEHGFTAIYVTHDQSEALAMSDKIFVLDRGRVIQRGTPREIYQHPVNSFVAEFIGTANTFDAQVLETNSAGRYRVATAMGELTVVSSEPPKSEMIRVCWRPEAARITEATGEDNTFTASVGLVVFQGNLTDILIHENRDSNEGLHHHSFRLQLFQRTNIARGDKITFRINPEDIRFLEAVE